VALQLAQCVTPLCGPDTHIVGAGGAPCRDDYIVATIVLSLQLFFTIRLMTAGPTGFEQSKLYYLNPNIVFYRHAAIRLMLNSLWIFMFAAGCRMASKFSDDAVSAPEWVKASREEPEGKPAPLEASGLTFLGGFICFFYLFLCLCNQIINCILDFGCFTESGSCTILCISTTLEHHGFCGLNK